MISCKYQRISISCFSGVCALKEIMEVDIEDEKQLDDSPENF